MIKPPVDCALCANTARDLDRHLGLFDDLTHEFGIVAAPLKHPVEIYDM